MDRVVSRLTSYAKGYMAAQDAARRQAERAGGRPEAGQLFGNSEQLGRSVKNIRYLIEDLSDDDAVAVVEIAENGGYATIAAGHLRALLAAAERGAGAEAGPAVREVIGGLAKLIHGAPPEAVRIELDDRSDYLAYDDIAAAARELNMEPPR